MKKVLGFAILATFLATPAFAGETFVRNEWTDSHTKTTTDLYLDSKTESTRNEKYSSWADKIYMDGSATSSCSYGCTSTVSFDEFTVHTAGSNLYGSFHENIVSKVSGTIESVTNSYTNSHETSAGVR